MKMSKDILTRLLKGNHINVEERKQLGLWPLEELKYEAILRHLVELITASEWFPFEPLTSIDGETIYEGIIIHQESPKQYVCYSSRAYALNPNSIAEQSAVSYSSPKKAAEYYLKWELKLPGRLDGWIVS